MRILGLDPGLNHTGWGIILVEGSRIRPVACGAISTSTKMALADRLTELFQGLSAILGKYDVDMAAVEEVFVNKNPASTLKLGMARGVVMLAPAVTGLPVTEYAATLVKKSLVGNGHADKTQMQMMIKTLLPGITIPNADAADALAVALCHAHHHQTNHRIQRSQTG